jgi:hypothetical protein
MSTKKTFPPKSVYLRTEYVIHIKCWHVYQKFLEKMYMRNLSQKHLPPCCKPKYMLQQQIESGLHVKDLPQYLSCLQKSPWTKQNIIYLGIMYQIFRQLKNKNNKLNIWLKFYFQQKLISFSAPLCPHWFWKPASLLSRHWRFSLQHNVSTTWCWPLTSVWYRG